MVKQVDTPDLKSCDQQWSCGFDSRSEYKTQINMTLTFKYYPCGTISLGTSVTRIPNSYRIKSIRDMEYIINRSREAINKNPAFHTFAINKRTTAGMIIEWRAHNMLYALHYKRARTRTVNLDINEPWYRKIGYIILSTLYLRW